MSDFFKMNDLVLPVPSRGLKVLRKQQYSTGTDALGRIIAQKINRRVLTIDSLKWNILDAETWQNILTEIEKLEGELTYYNVLNDRFEKIKVLWGETSETPFKLDEDGKVILYIDCICSFTDMGYDAEVVE